MKKRENIIRVLSLVGSFVALFLLVSFAPNREPGYRIDNIEVEIKNAYQNFFIDEEDVMALIMQNEGDSILGDAYGPVDLNLIEDRIESHSFVQEAEVYRDLKGHLVVVVTQNKPIARLISKSGESAYIGSTGDLLPTSTKYTAGYP